MILRFVYIGYKKNNSNVIQDNFNNKYWFGRFSVSVNYMIVY